MTAKELYEFARLHGLEDRQFKIALDDDGTSNAMITLYVESDTDANDVSELATLPVDVRE